MMCAIAGLWGEGDIRRIVAKLSHRGPDGEGFYIGDKVKLGARCLKIIGPSSDNQPLYNEDKSIAVILNGEVYNYPELKKELKNHIFKTDSDTEVIVHAYEEFGVDCVKRFNGSFAFAIWDGRRLILGRDRLGQKPLYYYHKDGRFIFASEIKGILSEIEAVPNLTEDFLVFETALGQETLFKDIYSVPRASLLIFDGSDITIRNYWNVDPDYSTDLNEQECIDKLRWLIQDATQLRLRADAPIGIFLSGGLDSSLITYVARPKYVFSCHYNLGGHFDEVRYAKLVAKDIGAEHHIVQPTPLDFQKHYAEAIWHLDQPVATASTLSAFLLAKEASRFVKVVLNGEGADELFSGYVRYLLMLTEEHLANVPELKNYHSLARYFWSNRMFGELSERYFDLTKRGIPETGMPLKRIKAIFSKHRNLLNAMSACDIEITLPSLLMMGDRASAAFGLENRSPYLDYRIVEFAFSLPPAMKVKEYQTKYILRKAARGIVPDEIIDRKDKKGLITPVFQWFSKELYEWTNDLISSFKERQIGIKRPRRRGEFDRYLYTLVSLELWYRAFIENKAPVQIDK
ncbi:MAG: asparagine synthase (glutamine-hydrolyzing) [Candidatus Omnitrophica bacterium]|nr:asparagine synthase (glutamine-hydrolyzing) [Candidatus Omnitrophota bacterium]